VTRALDLTQRQVRALCEGAKKAGYAPIIQIGKTVVRLVPEEHVILPQAERPIANENTDTEALDAELAAFEAQHGNG
jgi:hypothetical protein